MEEKKPDTNEENLEQPDTTVQSDADGVQGDSLESTDETTNPVDTPEPVIKAKRMKPSISGLISHLNIYFLLFILIVILALGLTFAGYQRSKKDEKPIEITTQPLTPEAIDQLKGNEAKVGDPKQTLSIESNAIFAGKVLIRDSLDVAGTIKVGGALSLPGITVSGQSNFDQIQANNLAIAGNVSVQGQLTIQQTLTVTGGASFGGPISAPQLSIQTLQLNNDLQLNRHIDAGGGTPGRSDGNALGSGGTSSVSGSDTAGTVTINTGSNTSAGCFTTINFSQRFNGTPHVVITPVGPGGASINYYINRSNTGFSICTANAAPAGQSFSYDYIAID